MLIHTLKKALMQGTVSSHRMDLIWLGVALMQVRSVNLKLACSLPLALSPPTAFFQQFCCLPI